MKLAAAEVASRVGGRLESGGNATTIEAVSIDSRTLEAGALFFAIEGPRHDGHRYCGKAMERGAVGVVVSRSLGSLQPGLLIRVADTAQALQELAAAVRQLAGLKVVGVTGSMGKTTTKEAAAAALSARYRVLKSEKNLNNLYGLPLSVLKHRDEEVAVLEMGMSAPGEIARLTEIARPDVGVLTNVAEVHREFFPSLDAIAKAKGELLEHLPETAVAVVNADDPLVLREARSFGGRLIRFGLEAGAEMRASGVRRHPEGVRFNVDYEGERVEVRSRLFGKHNVYNLLAALGTAAALGVAPAAAAAKLGDLTAPSRRGERLRFREGFLVIDETYNSNPSALASVLSWLGEEEASHRIAVLGDMLELGDRAEACHLEAGRRAAGCGLSLLVGVGPLGALIVAGARQGGMEESNLAAVENAEEAERLVAGRMGAGDVILFKASRGVGLDRAIDVIRTQFSMESV
jgi:UDP-N-acetylmuramoyl-tripeptide--D-alanyl-D-alanine ligase